MSYTHFNLSKRVQLHALLRAGLKHNRIAKILGKHPSSISRELKRNPTNTKTGYSVYLAKKRAKEKRIKANQRFRKIDNNPELKEYIIEKLKHYWSPEQIAGRLKLKQDKALVCPKTIYNLINERHPELRMYLRCQKGKYRRRYGTKIREKQREKSKKKRIDIRPEAVNNRERVGDWEGDLIFGLERTVGMLTHTDRMSGYTLADKMDSLLSCDVKTKAIKRFSKLPRDKRHTLTYDNDSRFAEYELIEREAKINIYFANPYHYWERGTNENTNGLLRQFFPKKSSFKNITQGDVDKAARLLNARPRKRLSYFTPAEVFEKNCASE